MTTHWARYLAHWECLGPPLRPHPDVIECVRALVGGPAKCLLLGATREYATLGLPIFAVDLSFPMLAGLWKSGDSSRLGMQADWTCLPIASGTISHVLGDGSLNAIPFSLLPAVLDEICRVLQPQGTLLARVFCRPVAAETPEKIARDLQLGRIGSFHALKWRIAMAALRDSASADIAVRAIRAAMMAQFPDREELCRVTGWMRAEVDTLDVYDGSSAIYNFPTEPTIVGLLRRWFSDVELVRCGTYPLADRCPLVVGRQPLRARE